MFSLKLFVVLLAVCICTSQAQHFKDCSDSNPTPCLCENSNLCAFGNTCDLGPPKKCIIKVSPPPTSEKEKNNNKGSKSDYDYY
uniref:Hirudin n=1 Tax=Hirudo nipponia TaxID=42736 RepID=A0A6C0SPD8_HIRNI|nr:hirudin [Hirudo nipponia]DBA44573.1 TPA_exp: hirudin variant hnip_hv3a [Hirudo nipponia]